MNKKVYEFFEKYVDEWGGSIKATSDNEFCVLVSDIDFYNEWLSGFVSCLESISRIRIKVIGEDVVGLVITTK